MHTCKANKPPRVYGILGSLHHRRMDDFSDIPATPEELNAQQIRRAAKQRAFLSAFRITGIVGSACEAASIVRSTVMLWRKDPTFEALYKQAEEDAADALEAEAHRRAFRGVQEPVVFKGMPTFIQDPETGERSLFTVTKYSDVLMQLLLKARKPDQFRDNVKVNHSIEQGVLVVPAAVDPESWAKAAAEQQAIHAGNTGESKT